MRGTLKLLIVIGALVLASSIRAAEVIDLRLGYWETNWTMPDKTLKKMHDCYTQEQLESLRFFMSPDENCSVLPGSQTRTHYESDMACDTDGHRMKIHVSLQTSDPMNFTALVTYDMEGNVVLLNATSRWLHDGCSYSDMPIS